MAQDILVPNIGDFKDVEVIEILIKEGDKISKGDSMITIESDKSSVEVPSSHAGVIETLHIKIGDKVSEGSLIASLSNDDQNQVEEEEKTTKIEQANSNSKKVKILTIPQVNVVGKLFVAQIHLSVNSEVSKDQTILTIEDDESSIDIPSPLDGTISEILVNKNDIVIPGQEIYKIIIPTNKANLAAKPTVPISQPQQVETIKNTEIETSQQIPSASPKIMKFARELGVDIQNVKGSGRLGRILEEDIKSHIRTNINKPVSMVEISKETKPITKDPLPYEHSEFGEVDEQNIPRIKRLSGPHLVRAWNEIPHVTQHDEIDVTEMENFRKNLVDLNTREKISITPLAFMMKALVNAMKKYPNFNSSLNGEKVIYKKYFHIGIAVDTPNGLMVPKIRNINEKNLSGLSKEVRKVSKLCKELKIDKKEFFGGSMTISSLGGIGGSFFTPIINAPEVAIIGIGRSEMKQIYIDGEFKPRMMMPISLSYDHRIIDGAEAAKFCQDLKISLGRNFALELAI